MRVSPAAGTPALNAAPLDLAGLLAAYFATAPDPSVPAQRVTISDHLNSSLDWDSFQLGEIGFGDTILLGPQGNSFLNKCQMVNALR